MSAVAAGGHLGAEAGQFASKEREWLNSDTGRRRPEGGIRFRVPALGPERNGPPMALGVSREAAVSGVGEDTSSELSILIVLNSRFYSH
ncbi:hypothetical protein SCH01S_53_00520 [Sphingomonas changbaiensis NBRC 104936]|uniref:Uncharacterized protein n=1 Tax=Sphingomonas changbaiensis NBRC 104936 TaxID=1219043 RepID=A0A0E9MV33_9SPHN|nr:hypothetical protein SCH01S_53_00520 [Sphingomonas changbaiensis NBRC 104936]